MIRLARIITGLLFASIIATHRMVSVRSCPSILRMLVSLRSLRIRHFIASLSETCIETLRTSVLTSPDVSSPSLQHLTSSDPALRSQSPKIERPQDPEPSEPRAQKPPRLPGVVLARGCCRGHGACCKSIGKIKNRSGTTNEQTKECLANITRA